MFSINLFPLSLLIHILSAIAWLGSLFAIEFIFIPPFISSPSLHAEILNKTNKKYVLIAQISSILILITGLYQTFDIGYLSITKLFQTTFGILILLKAILFFIFAGLGISTALKMSNIDQNIPKEKLQNILVNERKIFFIDLLVGLLIIIIAMLLTNGV